MLFWVVVVLGVGAVVIAASFGLLTLGYRFGEEAGFEAGIAEGKKEERRHMLKLVDRAKR